MSRWLPVLGALLLSLSAISCTSSSEPPDTTTEAPPITTLPSTTTSTQQVTTTSLGSVNELTPPRYQIVSRTATEAGGDEVVVLLDPTSYDSLTDIDIYDVIAEVVELFPPVAVMHVVDDPSAANVVTDPDASDAARAVLTTHYLARLDEGFRVTYLGPFAASGSSVLGS
jgi:hypothetical protein